MPETGRGKLIGRIYFALEVPGIQHLYSRSVLRTIDSDVVSCKTAFMRYGNITGKQEKSMGKFRIDTLVLGAMATNCYLVMNQETKQTIIIDPGAEPERVIRKIEEAGSIPEAILLTHGHFDHIGAAEALRNYYSSVGIKRAEHGILNSKPEEKWETSDDVLGCAEEGKETSHGVLICSLQQEKEICSSGQLNLSSAFGNGFTVAPDRFFEDGETVSMAGVKIRVLHTPGHTAGGACYYIEEEKTLFSGDTLFCCSVGRTDFPTGSMRELRNAIHTKLFVLPDDTLVLPGHGESTSIGYEKKYNPY